MEGEQTLGGLSEQREHGAALGDRHEDELHVAHGAQPKREEDVPPRAPVVDDEAVEARQARPVPAQRQRNPCDQSNQVDMMQPAEHRARQQQPRPQERETQRGDRDRRQREHHY